MRRVVYLYDPAAATPGMERRLQAYPEAANVEAQPVALRDLSDLTQAFAEFKSGTNGLELDFSAPMLGAAARICELALKRRLPTVGYVRGFPDAGCLMSYGEAGREPFDKG